MTQKGELPVGFVAGLFGVKGELKCDPSSAGRTLFSAGQRLRARGREVDEHVQLSSVREHKGRLLVRFAGADSLDAAKRFAGSTLYAESDRIALAPGEYLDRDLAGCVLYDERGAEIGMVDRVEHYPASDMLVVGGKLVPMVAAFVKSIDLGTRRIVVELPEGLLE
jgi:16S rRNA processing protein RimM